MTAVDSAATDLERAARDHLWMHFTRLGSYEHAEVPLIVRGEGAWIYDQHDRRIFDGLSGLYVVQAGHGREELARAAYDQANTLAYFPIWSYAHPAAAALAERLADAAPGDLDRVFFTTGGSEAVETAWKLARQYFREVGKPLKHKVISRAVAYHGTSMGALSITGIPALKQPFEPLVPSTFRVPNTNFYRATTHGDDLAAFGRWAADEVEAQIEAEGADTVAAVFVEPVQNAGGCFTPPPGYFARLREICDRHDVLLVSDEVICAFGRLGHLFGCDRYGFVPDMITCAKGLTSGYVPMGAVLASRRLVEPFRTGTAMFTHGITFGGHPVGAAVAMANLDLFEREELCARVLANEPKLRSKLQTLGSLPIVGDVRGDGYFFALELVRDQATKARFAPADAERVLRGFIAPELFRRGLHCRTDDRGDPVVQVAPPLIATDDELDLMVSIIADVLDEAAALL